jgi:hypothetical protein
LHHGGGKRLLVLAGGAAVAHHLAGDGRGRAVDAPGDLGGVSAALDASTSYGRIRNALKNTDGTADLNIHATTAYGDITARSL